MWDFIIEWGSILLRIVGPIILVVVVIGHIKYKWKQKHTYASDLSRDKHRFKK